MSFARAVSATITHDKATEIERLLKERYGKETHVAVHVEPIGEE